MPPRPRRLNLAAVPFGSVVALFVLGAFAVLRRNGNRFGDGADALEYLSEARRGGLAVSNAYERASGRAIGDGLYGIPLLAAVGAATRLAYAEGGAPAPATFAISPPALALGGDEFAFPAVGDYDVAATSASGVAAVFRVAARVEIKYSTRLQCAPNRTVWTRVFDCASRTRREQSIRSKISRIDVDLSELGSSEVW